MSSVWDSAIKGVKRAAGTVVTLACIPLGGGLAAVNIQQGYVGVVLEFGKFERKLEPGLWAINPVTQSVILVDVRTRTVIISAQSAMTKDNLQITADAVAYYTVVDVEKAIFSVADFGEAMLTLAQSTLRTVLGEAKDTIE